MTWITRISVTFCQDRSMSCAIISATSPITKIARPNARFNNVACNSQHDKTIK